MGHLTEAVALFETIREPLRIVSKELADELFRRFVSGESAPLYNDDSLMREEGRVLLVA
jgi:hypothetical protein